MKKMGKIGLERWRDMKKKRKKPYTETWYFRELAKDFTCEFIVRMHYDGEGRETGCLDVKLYDETWHFDFMHPVNMNLKGSIFLVLDKNVFTEACIHMDIDVPDLRIKGDIYFDHEIGGCRVSPKRKIWAMEQPLSGELWINGKEISFDGGKGYLEAQRSQSAEVTYRHFYSQCNWFGDKAFRIVCGGYGRHCFAVIDQDGYPIRLNGWKGAKVEYMYESGFCIRQGRYVLEGWRSEGNPATVRYRLTCKGDILFDEMSQRAVYQCVYR